MDSARFDRLTQSLSSLLSRRVLTGALGALALPVLAQAKKKRKKKHKKKKAKKNEFGCVNVGKYCKNDGQCCSGICKGKKDKKRCKAHDESTCQAGEDVCLAVVVECVTTTGAGGVCGTTTGKARYCFDPGTCVPCKKDTDCEPFLGAGAACIVCAECLAQGGTACGGLGVPA